MKKLFLILGLCFLIFGNAAAQTFEAKVNRSSLPEGETFLLTVELEGATSNKTPDFEALNDDFTIYSVANAYRTNIINGNVSTSQQWNLVLMPNKSGKLTIPAIGLENYKTQPLTINVGDVGTSAKTTTQSENRPKYTIAAEVDNKKPYVQQQINYTLILQDSGGLQGEEPTFQATNDNDWIIKSLGAPEISTQNINGANVREIKFHYALFPQRSGQLEIPAVRFNGYYLSGERRTDPFANLFNDDMFIGGFGMADVFATRTPVVLTAKPIKINVLPAAKENGEHWWLPAENVKLYAEFKPEQPKFAVGEAISRNIYLQATGVIDSQLPELKLVSSAGVKQYPEKPQTAMSVDKGKIIALEKVANVYIPTEAGKVMLPEISVNWFNVKSRKMEKAILPAMTVSVAGESTNPEPQTTMPNKQPIAPKTEVTAQNNSLSLQLGIAFALGVLLCLLIISLGKLLVKLRRHDYVRIISHAAKTGDIYAVRDNLLAWANNRFAGRRILSLQDIDATVGDKEFRCELDKLSEALYSKNGQDWNGSLFLRVFKRICKQKKGLSNNYEPLPKLYK